MQAASEKPKILLVEDYDDTRELYAAALRLAGYEVIEARDGRVALDWLRDHLPDLVLLDIGLPGMDGFQVAAAIREDLKRGDTPILILSALVHQQNAQELAARADALFALSKPCSPEELIDAVAAALQQVTPISMTS
jgi:two-component system cell cycle response regulator DivK